MIRAVSIALSCSLLVGCASLDPYRYEPAAQRLHLDGAFGDCVRLFKLSDKLIEVAGTRDAQETRVPGFPHLRVDRVVARLAAASDSDPRHARALTQALAALDDAGRRLELANAGRDAAALTDALATCRSVLALADQQNLALLREAAQVPDDYSSEMRALGLYPFTRYAFALGIRGWQRETLADFADTAAAEPARHTRARYVAATRLETLPRVKELPALGLPSISSTELARLIVRNAPSYEIETAGEDDHPGALAWQGDPERGLLIGVRVDDPVLYVRTGYAQLGERWLLQLIYTLWFPARPPTSRFDVLAGRLDGLLWRVTLAEDGTPLVYDTIHPCGCYHLFIPTEHVRARLQPESIDEGLFAPQTVHSPMPHERIVLRVAARTHYLQHVEVAAERRDNSSVLALRDDDHLRALSLPEGGTRSAFNSDGLIAGSERRERFYFWPMGVASAGQMRQWGRHATAFVGRRHFDDPTLIDRYFERVQ